MKRAGIAEFAALGLSIGLTPTLAFAQSVDIPLNYALNTGHNFGGRITNPVLILTINIGVNGGAAQSYAFDTGSDEFLTPNGVFTGATSTVLKSGLSNVETYGATATFPGYTFSGSVYQIPASSLQFYAAPGATTGGVTLSTSGDYDAASYTSVSVGTRRRSISQPFGTAVVGAFGAEPEAFSVSGTKDDMGSILGQTVPPNTTAGWVVSANGQSLAALDSQLGTTIPGGPVTGAQQSVQTVPQLVTNCNPCVTVGLTPALLAQFSPMNTVSSAQGGKPFPNSNIQGYDKFVAFNFALGSGSAPGTTAFSGKVSLDSGWTDFDLNYEKYVNSLPTNPVVTIDATAGGTQEAFNIASSSGVPSPYRLTNSGSDNINFLGIGFFVENSVLYNLAGQAEGYSPNFVTDANITTTESSPLVLGASSVPLGLAGIISGPGGVSITSGGSATLSGTNTYTGPTTVSGGYLAVVGPGSIATSSGLDVSAGGMFDISGTNSGASIHSLGGDHNGMVWLGSQTLTIAAAQDTFAGTISGSGGLTLTGGVEALSGTNAYTGPTNVNAGTLDITGSIASSSLTTVSSGAALSGTGTVGNLQVGPGGTFAPGSGTPGSSMTVSGNLAFESGAIYLVQVNPSTASFANVSGTASLAGAVNANFATGSYISKVYTILSAGSVSGKFGGLRLTNLPANFTASLAYDSVDAYLDLTLKFVTLSAPPPPVAPVFTPLNADQANIADSLINYFNTTGGIPTKFGTLSTSGLTAVDGEDATGAEHGAIELTNEFLSLMLDPFVYGRGGVASGGGALGFAPDQETTLPPDVALAYAGILKAPPKPVSYGPAWTAWGTGFGGSATFDGNATVGSNNVTASTYGFAAGADYHAAPDMVLGFALAGAGTNWDLAQGLGTGRSDAFQAGVYGTKYFGPAYLGAALAFTNNWFNTNRIALGDQLTANFDGQSFGARVEGGYRFTPSLPSPASGAGSGWEIGVTPYAAIQAQSFHTPSYSETDLTGGGFGLSYNAMNASDTRSELGARFDDLTTWNAMPVQLRARVAWAHDWVSDPALSAVFQALPGASFIVNGAPVPHDSALTSVGAELYLTQRWTLLGTFDGEFASSAQTYAGSGTLRYTW